MILNTSELCKYVDNTKILSKNRVMIRCLFHSDTHPSLLMTDKTYFCFGCKKKGSSFSLLNNVLKLDTTICRLILGRDDNASAQIFNKINTSHKNTDDHLILSKLFKVFQQNFQLYLETKDAKFSVLNFLVNKRKFKIDTLLNLKMIGYTNEDKITKFSLIESEFLRSYFKYGRLKWKNSLVIETWNAQSTKIVNLCFRSIEKKSFWYLPNKNKGFCIININQSEESIVLTEGFFDGLRLYESFNFSNIYCINGSSILKSDLKHFIQKFSKFILCFDNDEAGRQNTHKILLDILIKNSLAEIKIVKLIEKDADENFIKHINMEYYFSHIEFIKYFLWKTELKINEISRFFLIYHRLFLQSSIDELINIIKQKYNINIEQEFILKYTYFFISLKAEKTRAIFLKPHDFKKRFGLLYNFIDQHKNICLTRSSKQKLEILSKHFNLRVLKDIRPHIMHSNIDRLIDNIFIELKYKISNKDSF